MKKYFYKNRPLSPHLTVYKVQVTSLFSILQRIASIILFVILILILCVFKVFSFFGSYNIFNLLLNNIISLPLWFWISLGIFISLSLYYHLFSGIRHLFWDCGFNLTIKSIKYTTFIIFISSVLISYNNCLYWY